MARVSFFAFHRRPLAALAALATAAGLAGAAMAQSTPTPPGLSAIGARICGAPIGPSPAIRGAARFSPAAADASAPWMAKLEIIEAVRPDGSLTVSNCGAAAISRYWLITAGHCVGASNWIRVRATLGAKDLSSRAALKRTGAVALCPTGFDAGTLAQDVALVRLTEPLPADLPVLRLAGSAEAAALRVGASAVSAGWSRTGAQSLSPRLRRAEVRVVSLADRAGGLIVAAPERNEASLCVGESGGPLVADVGRGPAMMGVFSSVDAYRDRRTGRMVEICRGFEARSYFTPTADYRGWIGRAIEACEADLDACLAQGHRAQL